MNASTTRKPTESQASSEDADLDEILHAVAHAPPRRPPPEPVAQGTRWGAAGRYVIDQRLGRGGMGTVYSANDTLLGRVVALKVLDLGHSDDDDALRARLLREARLAAPIEHERIARVYDVGEEHPKGTLFVAMELVRGVTLRAWMRRSRRNGGGNYGDRRSDRRGIGRAARARRLPPRPEAGERDALRSRGDPAARLRPRAPAGVRRWRRGGFGKLLAGAFMRRWREPGRILGDARLHGSRSNARGARSTRVSTCSRSA